MLTHSWTPTVLLTWLHLQSAPNEEWWGECQHAGVICQVTEKSFACWSPLAAPAVCGADGELQEPSTAADGPRHSWGCGDTLYFSGFLGLWEEACESPSWGGRQHGRSAAVTSAGCAALSISSAMSMDIPGSLRLKPYGWADSQGFVKIGGRNPPVIAREGTDSV